MKRKSAKRIGFVLLAASVVCGLVTTALALDRYLDPFDDRSFDREVWAASEEREQDRGPMVRDALRHIPPGTPADRVRELLGEPQEVGARGDSPDRWGRSPQAHTLWTYYIGSWSAIGWYGLDSAFLCIDFDANARVVRAEINGG